MTSWAGPAFVLQPQGGQAYNSVVVDHSPFLVGRQSDSSLQLAHAAVSGRHAEIVYDGDGWWIVDCGSTNGTFVNGGCVDARARVEVGDLVHFATFGYEIVPAMQSTTEEDSPAIPTHVLTSSVDIKGLAELFNIVRDQHTYPLFQPVFVLANHETYGGRRWGAGCAISSGRLFHLASRNAVEAQLSERFRDSAVQCAVCRHCWPERTAPHLFFNLHPVGRPQSPFALFGADTSALPRTCPFVRLDVVGHYV